MVLLSDPLIFFQRMLEWVTFQEELLQNAGNEISFQRCSTPI